MRCLTVKFQLERCFGCQDRVGIPFSPHRLRAEICGRLGLPMSTRPIFTKSDIASMRAKGEVLPGSFLMRDENGRVYNMVLKLGSRITRPENALITDEVRVALTALADLTEYHRLGAESTPCDLSDLIDSGAAFACAHEARLRELVTPRIAQLNSWVGSKDRVLPGAPTSRPSTHTEVEWLRDLKDWDSLRTERTKQAKACVAVLKRAGF